MKQPAAVATKIAWSAEASSPRVSSNPAALAKGAAEGRARGAGARFKNVFQMGTSRSPTPQTMIEQVIASQKVGKIGRNWLNLMRTKDEDGTGSPYMQWLQESGSSDVQPRQAWFHTIGRAPVEAPVRPARLTPVRQMSPTPPPMVDSQGSGTAGNIASGLEWAESGSGATGIAAPRTLQKTFSRECCHIMRDQNVVMPFDAMKIFLACSFFAPCSMSFLRELLSVGGEGAWKGISMNSGCTVYGEGDPGSSMFVVARGIAEVVKEGKLDYEVSVGAHFGEAQVLGIVSHRKETVRAKSSLHLLEITPSTLTRLLKRSKGEDDESEPDDEDHSGAGIGRALRLAGNAFMEERRHFEGEAVRIYREHVGERMGSTFAGNDRSRLGRTTKVYLGKLAGLEDIVIDPASTPTDSPGRSQSKEQESMTQSAGQRSPRRTFLAASPKSPASSKYSFDDAQESVADCVCASGGAETSASAPTTRERLVTHLVQSLRSDMRRGYMMPADSLGGAKSGYASAKSKCKKSVAKRRVSVSPARRKESAVCTIVGDLSDNEQVDDEACDPLTAPLDIQMLPPIGLLSPAQKHGLLQQLRADARAKVTHLLVAPGRKNRLESMAELLQRKPTFQLETRFEVDSAPGSPLPASFRST